MSIEQLLQENNDMLKKLLNKIGNCDIQGKTGNEIDNLPDATKGQIPESNPTEILNGGGIKKIKLRNSNYLFPVNNETSGGDLSVKYPDDIETNDIETNDIETNNLEQMDDLETEKVGGNLNIKISGNKPPKILKIFSIKTKKGKKGKKGKKITLAKNSPVKKTKRALTGYQLFMKEQMPIWKKENPNKTHQDAFKAIAKLWKTEKNK